MAPLALPLVYPSLGSVAGPQLSLSYCHPTACPAMLLLQLYQNWMILESDEWLPPRSDTAKKLTTGKWRTNTRNSGLKSSMDLQMGVVLCTWLSHQVLQIIHLLCVSPADSSAELRIKKWITSPPEYSPEIHTWKKKHIPAQSYINWNFYVIYVLPQIHTYTSSKKSSTSSKSAELCFSLEKKCWLICSSELFRNSWKLEGC